MNSNVIIVVFIVEFIVLAVWGGLEGRWAQMLYGAGGAILNVGVLLMGSK